MEIVSPTDQTFVDRAELSRRTQSLRSEGSPGALAEAARLEREAEASRLAELRGRDDQLTPDERGELVELEKGEAHVKEQGEPEPADLSADADADDGDDEPDATDAARELAQDEGVDLATVKGTGEGGRITKGDVQKAAS